MARNYKDKLVYKYFTEDELKCSHCGNLVIDDEFIKKIEALREAVGFPFVVSSAYRCEQHPIEKRKSTPGAHVTGKAMDIHVTGEKALTLLEEALKAGFTGIRINQKGQVNSRFIHLDIIDNSSTRPRPWIWSY